MRLPNKPKSQNYIEGETVENVGIWNERDMSLRERSLWTRENGNLTMVESGSSQEGSRSK